MKQFVACIALLLMSINCLAKDNFKMSGKIKGVVNDTLCIHYVVFEPERHPVVAKVPVVNGEFSFSAHIDGWAPGHVNLLSNTKKKLTVDFIADEEAVLNGELEYYSCRWGGSAYYQQYQNFRDALYPFHLEYDAGKKEGSQDKVKEAVRKMEFAALKYIEEHPDEDAMANAVIDVHPDQIMYAIGKLSPRVRNGRLKRSIDGLEKWMKQAAKMEGADEIVKDDTVKIGDEVPELGLKDMKGEVLEMKSLRGKYVMLDFWGSWCGWCIKGYPKLKEYYAKYKDKLEVVGIDCNDKEKAWKDCVKKHNLPWLQVRSEDGVTEMKFRVEGFPYKVLISPEGKVLKAVLGETDEFYQYLDTVLGK